MARIRTAIVTSKRATLSEVERYLPGNYSAVNVRNYGEDAEQRPNIIVIVGDDAAGGFGLDNFVRPRLASGLIGTEVVS